MAAASTTLGEDHFSGDAPNALAVQPPTQKASTANPTHPSAVVDYRT